MRPPFDPTSIRLVTFDLDDTLVATSKTIPARITHMLRRAEALACFEFEAPRCDELIQLALHGNPDARPRNVLAEIGLSAAHPAFATLVEAYGELTLELIEPLDGAAHLLEVLAARFRIAVITNGEESLQRAKLRAAGLDGFFGAVFASETCGYRKPASEIFHLACGDARVAPAQAVHIGDSFETDVAGAIGAGMAAVWLRGCVPAVDRRAATAFRQIEHLSQLLSLVRA